MAEIFDFDQPKPVPGSGADTEIPKRMDNAEGKVSTLERMQEVIIFVMLGLLTVLLFQMGSMWMYHFDAKRATYEDLRDEVEEQNRLLHKALENQVYLENKISDIPTKVATTT